MPEHVSIQYDHPGNCPLCGMTLVPVTASLLEKIQPGGRLEYYVCPMPEHANVHLDKPGKCPRCGMTLIPVMAAAPAPAALPTTLYTCPMASHADVVSDQPGKCPKCDMELVPTSSVAHGKTAKANWRQQHAATPGQPVPQPGH
jgi:rubrerythrin